PPAFSAFPRVPRRQRIPANGKCDKLYGARGHLIRREGAGYYPDAAIPELSPRYEAGIVPGRWTWRLRRAYRKGITSGSSCPGTTVEAVADGDGRDLLVG